MTTESITFLVHIAIFLNVISSPTSPSIPKLVLYVRFSSIVLTEISFTIQSTLNVKMSWKRLLPINTLADVTHSPKNPLLLPCSCGVGIVKLIVAIPLVLVVAVKVNDVLSGLCTQNVTSRFCRETSP